MTTRLLTALGSLLALAAPLCAQPAGEAELPPPPPATEGMTPPVVSIGPVESAVAWSGDSSPGQFWVTADYLLTWFQGVNLPPLVTTSPAGTPQDEAGVLGAGTTSLFNGRVNTDVRSGFRFGIGGLFAPDAPWGAEAGCMVVESQSTIFSASSDGTPILARPFFNALTDAKDAVLIAFPGVSTGSVDVRASSGNFYEAHVAFTERLFDGGWGWLDALIGYRFFRYDDGLLIQQAVFPTGPNFVPGTEIDTVDDFTAQNQFHGGDMGFRALLGWQDFSLDLLAKVAVGGMARRVEIAGFQKVSVPGSPTTLEAGGVYALATNIGTFHSTDWGIFPEFGGSLCWQAGPNLRLRLGYSLLMLFEVARAAQQVDFHLNPNFFPPVTTPPGTRQPTFSLVESGIWMQAINLGMEVRY